MQRRAGQQAEASLPVCRYTYNAMTGQHVPERPRDKFIKGPIPLNWIQLANGLPGKAGAVGLALWFLSGVQRSASVRLTGEVERIARCDRKTTYRALTALDSAGLISVARRRGARPIATLLDARSNLA
jgi:hypothetical protein